MAVSKNQQTISNYQLIKGAYVNFVAMEFSHDFHLATTSVQQKDGIHSQTHTYTQ